MRKLWPYSRSITKRAVKTLVPIQELWDRLFVPLLLISSISIFFISQAEHGFFEDLIHQGAVTRQVQDPADILVVLVDQETRALLGQNSDSTQSLACLTAKIMAGLPRVIALDYYFTGNNFGSAIKECNEETSFERLTARPIVVASLVEEGAQGKTEVPPSAAVIPHDKAAWGHASVEVTNRNEVARKIRPLVKTNHAQGPIPSLAIAAWLSATNPIIPSQVKPRDFIASCLSGTIENPQCRIISDLNKPQRLNFTNSHVSITVKRARDFFTGICKNKKLFDKYCRPKIEDRIVIIGSSRPNSYDAFASPLDTPPPVLRLLAPSSLNKKTPGVMIHAVALDNLIHNRFIEPASFRSQLSIGVFGFVLILISFYFALKAGQRLSGGRLIAGSVGFVFLLVALVLFLVGFIIPYRAGVALLQEEQEMIFLSAIWPIYLVLTAGIIFLIRLRARAVILANNSFIWRHVGPRARKTSSVRKRYYDVIKQSPSGTEHQGMYVEFRFKKPSIDNKFYPTQAYLLQSELLEIGDQVVEYTSDTAVVPFIDNWSKNVLRMYLLCEDSPSDKMMGQIHDYITSLDRDSAGRLRRYPTLGVVKINVHEARISVVNIPGAIEENILTVSARQRPPKHPVS